MAESPLPGRATAQMTVVTLPAEIDAANAHRLSADLHEALVSGVTNVVVDMTATAFCDSRGVRALVLASQWGEANGAELRLVPSAEVIRILTVMGLDGWLTIYPSLGEALAGKPVLDADAPRG